MNRGAGYVDLQINGYGGVDFNSDDLSDAAMHGAAEALRRDGVDGVLATIITDRVEVMASRLRRIATLREADPLVRDTVIGIHIEGPFINAGDGFRGAHPADAIIPADPDAMERLLEAAAGLARIVTLAPERDAGLAVTRMLADRSVIVAAGHTDASVGRLRAAIDAGLSMFTHLGNGCPAMLPRHDNIIQRVLSVADHMDVSFIADGAHVPFPALGNYLRCAGLERCVVVTDAIAPAGRGPGRYTLSRWELEIGEDLVARAPDGGHLVGSAVSMSRAERNLIEGVGLSADQAAHLTRVRPREILGMPPS